MMRKKWLVSCFVLMLLLQLLLPFPAFAADSLEEQFTLSVDVQSDADFSSLSDIYFTLRNSASGQYLQAELASNKYLIIGETGNISESALFHLQKDGAVQISGLSAGTYSLELTTLPDGFTKMLQPVVIELGDTGASVNGQPCAVLESTVDLTLNLPSATPLPDLSPSISVMTVVAGGVLILSASWILLHSKTTKE